jgi:hypothetical protein
METCKTCKFWPSGDGVSGLVKMSGEIGEPRECLHPKITRGYGVRWGSDVKDAEYTPDCAVVENDEGWGFMSGPDFGCIHHEKTT